MGGTRRRLGERREGGGKEKGGTVRALWPGLMSSELVSRTTGRPKRTLEPWGIRADGGWRLSERRHHGAEPPGRVGRVGGRAAASGPSP